MYVKNKFKLSMVLFLLSLFYTSSFLPLYLHLSCVYVITFSLRVEFKLLERTSRREREKKKKRNFNSLFCLFFVAVRKIDENINIPAHLSVFIRDK